MIDAIVLTECFVVQPGLLEDPVTVDVTEKCV